jgi:hypothetical protein
MTPAKKSLPAQTGILVSTAITAGIDVGFGERQQHAEGIVVSTSLAAGGANLNHAEGVVAAS